MWLAACVELMIPMSGFFHSIHMVISLTEASGPYCCQFVLFIGIMAA
jgi:hypothetical protein